MNPFTFPHKQTSAGYSPWVETHWACSGNDVTLQDNGTQAWEAGADFNQMCVCRSHLLEERNWNERRHMKERAVLSSN